MCQYLQREDGYSDQNLNLNKGHSSKALCLMLILQGVPLCTTSLKLFLKERIPDIQNMWLTRHKCILALWNFLSIYTYFLTEVSREINSFAICRINLDVTMFNIVLRQRNMWLPEINTYFLLIPPHTNYLSKVWIYCFTMDTESIIVIMMSGYKNRKNAINAVSLLRIKLFSLFPICSLEMLKWEHGAGHKGAGVAHIKLRIEKVRQSYSSKATSRIVNKIVNHNFFRTCWREEHFLLIQNGTLTKHHFKVRDWVFSASSNDFPV